MFGKARSVPSHRGGEAHDLISSNVLLFTHINHKFCFFCLNQCSLLNQYTSVVRSSPSTARSIICSILSYRYCVAIAFVPMSHQQQSLDDWLKPFAIEDDMLCTLTRQLSSTYTSLALNSSEQFLATPVTKLPSGHERGEFLAIDLGGTNLRVAFVSLLGQDLHEQESHQIGKNGTPLPNGDDQTQENVVSRTFEKSWPIGAHLKADNAEHLFAWLGDCLAEVIGDRLRDGGHAFTKIPLGITFSFPMMYVLYTILLFIL